MSVVLGLLYGVLLPTLPGIPMPGTKLPSVVGSLVWGGLLLPIFWSSVTYSLMGLVNPVLQARVNWPWFIISQFVFGVVAAVVVDRSETVPVPPAGRGVS